MANGLLGKADLVADTDTLLCTLTTDQTVNVRVANRNVSDIKVRVAIGTGGSPASADYIDYDLIVPANGIMEDTGIVASSGEKIWVRSNTANASVRVHGLEV